MFSTASASRMRSEGLKEEVYATAPPLPATGADQVQFTPSALADWRFLAAARIIGAPLQYHELLAKGLAELRHGAPPQLSLTCIDSDTFVWQQQNLRWVIRSSKDWEQVIVHGIAREAFDPFRKLWRYFNQFKAIDLLNTSQLYLRRLDRLEADPFEGRPTQPMFEHLAAMSRSVFVDRFSDPGLYFENQRRATYTCCWQKLEHESAEMWRDYCNDNGGLAIQSTERQLQHQFAQMQKANQDLYFREVDYIDHESHNPDSCGFPEQAFLKRKRYADERETRFVRFLPEVICGTQEEIEQALASLPDGQRVPFDISSSIETVIVNPCASVSDRQKLFELIATYQPTLVSRVRDSALSM